MDKNVPPLDRLNADFWNDKYKNQTTGWDLGEASPPLKTYIDSLIDRKLHILLPGAGNAYEAAYLASKGFESITIIDIAPALIESLKIRFSTTPSIKVLLVDFFQHQGQYDLILEQTFFCAIHPSLRKEYVIKMNELLKPMGSVVGVLFNRTFELEGPPFGGSTSEYETLFSTCFGEVLLSPCYNSHVARAGTELFVRLRKPF